MKIRRKSTEPRDTVLTIRLSNAEKMELKKRASSSGLSVGAFLIDLALDSKTTQSIKNTKTTRSANTAKSTKGAKTTKNSKNTKSTTGTRKQSTRK